MPLPPLTSVPIDTPARVDVAKYVRNGLVPHASFESRMGLAANFIGATRTKELFRWSVSLSAINEGKSGTTSLWRFAGRTSPYHQRIVAVLYMAPQDSGSTSFSPSATVAITNAAESTTYATKTVSFGSSAVGTTAGDVPSEFAVFTTILSGAPTDTAIFGRIDVADTGRLVGVCLYEESLAVDDANGYTVPSAVAAGSPIYDGRRESLYEMATSLWKGQAAHLFNWTVDDQSAPKTNATATVKSVFDGITIDSGDARIHLDLSYCGTRARSTVVPCVFAVRAKMSGATETGIVTLGSSNSGDIVSLNVTGTTAQWHSTTVDLEAAEDDYYVSYFNSDGTPTETLSVYAASLYQYKS